MKWQLIVEEKVVGVEHVSLTGTKPGNARGMDFATLSPCYFRFVKRNVVVHDAVGGLKAAQRKQELQAEIERQIE